MKKIIILLICSILVLMPAISGSSFCKIKEKLDERIFSKGFSSDPEDAPDWAVGNFSGTWGLNFFGNDWIRFGPVEGFYGKGFVRNFKFGRFLIHYNQSNEENGSLLEGLFFGPYLLGKSTNEETGNSSSFVGLGGYNETHFRWRIMGMEGPTIFLKGIFTKF